MTETIFYIKKGRKYIPHSSYSSEFCDSFPKGTHLVQSYPGGSSRRFNIDPAYAPMIAAGRVAEDVISKRIMDATEIRRNTRNKETPLTPGQKAAWDKLVEEFGPDAKQLEWPSARECAEAAVKAMQEEADKLLTNPMVRKAYERFLFVAELTREHGKTADTP
jgi:hypothetical protein